MQSMKLDPARFVLEGDPPRSSCAATRIMVKKGEGQDPVPLAAACRITERNCKYVALGERSVLLCVKHLSIL